MTVEADSASSENPILLKCLEKPSFVIGTSPRRPKSQRSPTGLDIDERQVDFNIISGTSIACPYVSGNSDCGSVPKRLHHSQA